MHTFMGKLVYLQKTFLNKINLTTFYNKILQIFAHYLIALGM